MIILALDVATRTGWALGRAGGKPQVGAIRLRTTDDRLTKASNNIGYFLKDKFVLEKPDLVVYEQPLDPNVKAHMAEKNGGRMQNSASIMLPFLNMGVIEFMCDLYGVRIASSNRQAVLRHFTGNGRYGGGDEGRKRAKDAVINRCHLLKLMPLTSRDEDIADAIAIHHWASAYFARVQRTEFYFFGQEGRTPL